MIVDAHIHLYDPRRPEGVPFPSRDDKLLYRPMLPTDFRQVAEPVGVRGAVIVECSPWLEDNQWVLDLVASDPFVCAVIGNLDIESVAFPILLERFARNPLFRGIRIRTPGRVLNFAHPRLRPNLATLAATRCTLELVVKNAELVPAARLAREQPGLRIMLDHLAFVPISSGSPDPVWVESLQAFADLPNVYCKVSRFTEQATIQPGPIDVNYYVSTFEAAWKIFGPDRLVYGSNWPPCLGAGDYCTTVILVRDFFSLKGEATLTKIMARNAAAFYGGSRFPV